VAPFCQQEDDMTTRTTLLLALALMATQPAAAQPHRGGFDLEVLIDGQAAPVHAARGTRYVEAVKGAEYAIRLRNPLGVRVAVALSVDGLNSIDAKRTPAATARKWVLGPYETVVISGWQTSSAQARRFYFTSEEQSYAQWLGQSNDMGIISAVFYRERVAEVVPLTSARPSPSQESRAGADRAQPAPAAPGAAGSAQDVTKGNEAAAKREVYAATGIGRHTDHRVEQVHLDLERTPVATLDLRYEFRPQLVKLGVLPPEPGQLTRRERARGFEKGFCPEPK
jgi:hypothetical protein